MINVNELTAEELAVLPERSCDGCGVENIGLELNPCRLTLNAEKTFFFCDFCYETSVSINAMVTHWKEPELVTKEYINKVMNILFRKITTLVKVTNE